MPQRKSSKPEVEELSQQKASEATDETKAVLSRPGQTTPMTDRKPQVEDLGNGTKVIHW